MLKTQRIRASPSCSTERPVLVYGGSRLWSRQTVKISTVTNVSFSLAFYSWYFAFNFGLIILTSCKKLSRLGRVHHVQLKGPFLAYRGWRLWSRQTVKKSTRCTLFFSFPFLILYVQFWFDDPKNILKTQRIMASPSCSTERPTFGSWWIKALKPSDGKTSKIVMYLIF